MRVVVVTGIFPPDIGGPATHSADLVDELTGRGHDVRVLTLTEGAVTEAKGDIVRFPRRWAWPRRVFAAILWLVRLRRSYDVVYATGLGPVAVLGARLARRPVVLKIVGDPAWERGARLALTELGFDEFQANRGLGARVRAMRVVRDWSVRHADALVTPSRYLADVVEGWSGRRGEVTVVPNGVRSAPSHGPARQTRSLRVIWVGRLVAHKRVGLLLDVVAATPGLHLDIIGDGPERATIEAAIRDKQLAGHVEFTRSLPHEAVLERIAAADVFVSASSYEGLPHVVIEALACGTVVVATPAGGVVEVITDGVDGLLVDDSASGLAQGLTRLRDEEGLLEQLAAGASRTGEQWRIERCADQIEVLLASLTSARPFAVFVGRSRLPAPLPEDLLRKFTIHGRHLRCTQISSGRVAARTPGGVRIVGFPAIRPAPVGSALFYTFAPPLAVAMAAGTRPAAVVCQSPFEGLGAGVAARLVPRRWRPAIQVELHGDWRTAARLYGSPLRRTIAPVADRLAEWALRRADRVRSVSVLLGDQAREVGYIGPLDRFITFSDYSLFLDPPLAEPPAEPRALFIGVLERYKAVDVLLDAWPAVIAEVPDATLTIIGRGNLGPELHDRVGRERLPGVTFLEPMGRAELREMIDRSSLLVLPSRLEGLPRIVMEAMARARPVVASNVGGMEELIDDQTGRLVAAEDVVALSDALVEVLGSPAQARAMGRGARQRVEDRNPLVEYEAGIRRLAAWIESDANPA